MSEQNAPGCKRLGSFLCVRKAERELENSSVIRSLSRSLELKQKEAQPHHYHLHKVLVSLQRRLGKKKLMLVEDDAI